MANTIWHFDPRPLSAPQPASGKNQRAPRLLRTLCRDDPKLTATRSGKNHGPALLLASSPVAPEVGKLSSLFSRHIQPLSSTYRPSVSANRVCDALTILSLIPCR